MKKNNVICKIARLALPFKEKVFIYFRYLSAPLWKIEALTPKNAKILDVGCGHGLLELVLKEGRNQRNIYAIDPDKNKIKSAKKIKTLISDTAFRAASLFQVNPNQEKFDFIVMCDVDYLLATEEKTKIFFQIKKLLNKKGRFLLKTVIKNNSIGYYLGYVQEIVTVFLFKKTFTENNHLHFLTKNEYRGLLKSCGYTVLREGQLKTIFYHPHYFFIAK